MLTLAVPPFVAIEFAGDDVTGDPAVIVVVVVAVGIRVTVTYTVDGLGQMHVHEG